MKIGRSLAWCCAALASDGPGAFGNWDRRKMPAGFAAALRRGEPAGKVAPSSLGWDDLHQQHTLQAVELEASGSIVSALDQITKAHDYQPHRYDTITHMARLQSKTGQHEEALSSYRM